MGVHFSGGIDSSVVATKTSEALNGNIDTYTYGYNEEKYSEIPFAKNVSDALGVKNFQSILKYEDLDEKTQKLGVYHPNWLCDPNHTPPEGESYNDLYLRVVNSLKKIINKGSSGDYVIFSHGGPIRAAISFALYTSPEASLPFRIDNISVSRLDFIENSWQIKFINLIP